MTLLYVCLKQKVWLPLQETPHSLGLLCTAQHSPARLPRLPTLLSLSARLPSLPTLLSLTLALWIHFSFSTLPCSKNYPVQLRYSAVKNVTLTLKTTRKQKRIPANAECPGKLQPHIWRVCKHLQGETRLKHQLLRMPESWHPLKGFFCRNPTPSPPNPQVCTGKMREDPWEYLPWLGAGVGWGAASAETSEPGPSLSS